MGWRWTRWAAACALGAALAASGGELAAQDAGAEAKLEVKVLDASGRPVAGATVAVLDERSEDARGAWIPGFAESGQSMSDGTVKLKPRQRLTTVMAWKGDSAGIADKATSNKSSGTIEVHLGPGRTFSGAVLDSRSAPVANARARAVFRRPMTSYHVDAVVAADSTWKTPPLPAGAWDVKGCYIEAGPPTGQPKRTGVEKERADKPFTFRFGAMRKLCGVVVPEDGMPLREGRVFIPLDPTDSYEGLTATFDKDGIFSMAIAPTERMRLYVSDVRHAPTIIHVDEGTQDVDVGKVTIGAGKPLEVFVQEADGTLVTQAAGTIEDEDGIVVGRALLEGKGRILFANVPEGSLDVTIYVQRYMGGVSSRRVSRSGVKGGGEPLKIDVPPGLVVKLVDPAGKPLTLSSCAVEVKYPWYPRPWRTEFSGGGIKEMRLEMWGGITVDVAVIGADAMRGELKGVAIDAAGNGDATVTVKGPR